MRPGSPLAPAPITYVILAHDKPTEVIRLALAILREVPESRVLVHYSSLSGPFCAIPDERIVLVENPAAVHWATFSLTEMMLRSLAQIRLSGLPDSWIVMLSGQSYPVRPLAEMERMLADCKSDAYFWFKRIEDHESLLRERFLFDYRRIRNGPLPFPLSVRALRGLLNRIQGSFRLKSMPRTSFLGSRLSRTIFDVVPNVYHATQWIALSRKAAEHIAVLATQRSEILDVYRQTIFAEESFFATAILNEPILTVHNDDLHYTDWSTIRSGSPKLLRIADIKAIENSRKWFARKVDLDNDDGLRNALDALRARQLDVAVPPLEPYNVRWS